MKHYLYHVTDKENVPNIIYNEGLKRKGFAVYLSENPFSWWKPGLAILRVRTTGLNLPMTTFLPESDEVLVYGDINPERIWVYDPPRKDYKRAYKNLRERGVV